MTVIKHRRGTVSQWTAANPVLAEGEIGFETDTGKHKIGNGTSAWLGLHYFVDESGLLASFVPKWTALTVYTATTLVLSPTGTVIQRTADGTSRATYDVTEQAAWTTVSGGTPADASTSVKGILKLSTGAQAIAGTDAVTGVTPAALKALVDTLRDLSDSALGTALANAYAARMTTVSKSIDYTVGALEFVEVDATAAVRTMIGPAAGATKRWGVKKVNGTSALPGNKVIVSYINASGVTTLVDLTLAGESKIFRPSGSGYRVETGDTPRAATDYAYVPISTKALVSNLPTPFYIAHRGGSLMGPEETLQAYRLAVAAGTHVIECDVWSTADGVAICSHDATADRATNGTGNWNTMTGVQASKLVMDYATLMPQSPNGWLPENLLLFETFLREFGNQVCIAPELSLSADYAVFKACIERVGVDKRTIIMQTTSAAIAVQAIADGFPYIMSITNATGSAWSTLAGNGYTFVAQDQSTIIAGDVSGAHAAGIKLIPYSPSSHARRDALLALGVDGFFTDDPGYVVQSYPWQTSDLFAAQDITYGVHALQGVAPQFFTPDKMGWAAGGAGSTTKIARVGYLRSAGPNGVATFKAQIDADGGAPTVNGIYFYLLDQDDTAGTDAQVLANGYVFFVRADGAIQIRKITAGVFSSLTSVTAQTPWVLTTDYNYKITIAASGANSLRFERVDGAGASIGTPITFTDNSFRPAHWRHLISCIGSTCAIKYHDVDLSGLV